MTILLKPLPFSPDALEPHISAATVQLHHERHEAGYVERVNRLISSTKLADQSLEQIVASARDLDDHTLFNMAAQAWNHSFYWSSLHPRGGGLPHGAIATLIDKDFGGYPTFAERLRQAATDKFGSGWAWLVLQSGKLEVIATSNADLPSEEQIPLLVIDVWEHAYYMDYQYRRAAYVAATIEHLLNWEFANERLRLAEGDHHAWQSRAATIGLRPAEQPRRSSAPLAAKR
jgi:Fe-Mn family superoxide dismutase